MAFGLHFGDTWAGRVFSQSSLGTGLAIPIYNNTAITGGSLPILNPGGSNVNVELISLDIEYGGTGTAALTVVGLMSGFCAGIGTGTGCSALAATTPVNCNFGVIGGSKVISTNAGTVTVTAGTITPPVNGIVGAGWVRSLASLNLESTTGTAHGTLICNYTFNGTVCSPPGVITYFAGSLASVAVYSMTVVWKEVPIR